ncbi:hypothetical protein QYE76_046321 [Lolium multiflorum]|uniref:Uncharacterized protein n=1 Tax=Lolium multiflorum TaxID=4521 RepID=A0AAD8X0Z2_LOLMU|nr:hypothetical protein QYE76_046321 [Lolium multiflorum]
MTGSDSSEVRKRCRSYGTDLAGKADSDVAALGIAVSGKEGHVDALDLVAAKKPKQASTPTAALDIAAAGKEEGVDALVLGAPTTALDLAAARKEDVATLEFAAETKEEHVAALDLDAARKDADVDALHLDAPRKEESVNALDLDAARKDADVDAARKEESVNALDLDAATKDADVDALDLDAARKDASVHALGLAPPTTALELAALRKEEGVDTLEFAGATKEDIDALTAFPDIVPPPLPDLASNMVEDAAQGGEGQLAISMFDLDPDSILARFLPVDHSEKGVIKYLPANSSRLEIHQTAGCLLIGHIEARRRARDAADKEEARRARIARREAERRPSKAIWRRPVAERSSPTSAASLAAVPPGTSAASPAAAKAIAPVTCGFTAPDGQFVTREWMPCARDLATDGFLGPSSSSQMPQLLHQFVPPHPPPPPPPRTTMTTASFTSWFLLGHCSDSRDVLIFLITVAFLSSIARIIVMC